MVTLTHRDLHAILCDNHLPATYQATVGTDTGHEEDTYCTRCRRYDTDARDVYYPLSDEYIQLCTDCEPDNTAISPFELWH